MARVLFLFSLSAREKITEQVFSGLSELFYGLRHFGLALPMGMLPR
jgi:hypothetical protein